MSLIRQGAKALFALADLFLPSPSGPRILIYHQVGAGTGRQTDVTLSDFEWQLNWLSRNREVVSLTEALERWEESQSENLVVLTFDDGYVDLFTKAFTLLEERGLPFVVYLSTEGIERGIGSTDVGSLTWGHLEEMLGSGLMTIGAHTHTHADLRKLGSDAVFWEIATSNDLIKDRLGSTPEHFAYPWGYWSPHADFLVRDHYRSAVLGAPSLGDTERGDRFRLHRFPIQLSDGRRWLAPRLRGGLVTEEALRRRIRGYQGH